MNNTALLSLHYENANRENLTKMFTKQNHTVLYVLRFEHLSVIFKEQKTLNVLSFIKVSLNIKSSLIMHHLHSAILPRKRIISIV